MSADATAYCAAEVRSGDPDRFLASLFAPEPARGDLMAIYAFNLEVSRTRDMVSEPMLGEIRLQWWREAIESIYAGRPRQQPVSEALTEAITRAGLPQAPFLELIDAHAFDLYNVPMETRAALTAYARHTSSTLFGLAARILAPEGGDALLEAADHAGVAWTYAELLRSADRHITRGQIYLPKDLLEENGVSPDTLRASTSAPGFAAAMKTLAWDAAVARRRAIDALKTARLRSALPAFLPLALVPIYLARLAPEEGLSRPPLVPLFRRQLILLKAAIRGWP